MSSLDIRKLLDLDSINHLLDLFTDLTGVAAILVDTNGNYVSKKGNYSRHCDLIHSVPDGLKACEKFSAELGARAVKDGTFAHGWCPFLLYDSTAPIMVKGEVVGFVGMGQILPEPPDMEKHRQIAKRMGLDQEAFLDSIRELKMMSLEEFKKITNIFGALASILSHIGLKRLESEKQADQLSREMELIVQNLPIGINLLSPDLDMLLLNPFLEERVGLTTEQVKGKKCYDVVGDYKDDPNRKGAERICDKCPAMRALRSGRPQKQVRTVRPDFVVENTSVPITDAQGKTIRLMEIILDITEKKNLEAQLLHAQKMEAIGTLAGGVSHDFNNILTGILGFTQLLMNKESLSGDGLSYLKRIEHEVKRAADLTTQLLTFSRRMDPQRKPTDLNKTVKETTSVLARTIPKTIAIETVLAGDLKTIYADPGQSEQILMNLAINARDAILQKGEHGTIRIETANVALDDQYCRH
ncbi:MAG: PocR ligand-binding domain-containing protein, partial [Deltaproteobacteria bacterium]|nr:PocR ligand-binding domain-containing protein [Deltaproteobacteria bacterium]